MAKEIIHRRKTRKTREQAVIDAGRIAAWCEQNPDGNCMQCARELGIKYDFVYSHWPLPKKPRAPYGARKQEIVQRRKTREQAIKNAEKQAAKDAERIAAWCEQNPDGNCAQCERELGLGYTFVYNHWPLPKKPHVPYGARKQALEQYMKSHWFVPPRDAIEMYDLANNDAYAAWTKKHKEKFKKLVKWRAYNWQKTCQEACDCEELDLAPGFIRQCWSWAGKKVTRKDRIIGEYLRDPEFDRTALAQELGAKRCYVNRMIRVYLDTLEEEKSKSSE